MDYAIITRNDESKMIGWVKGGFTLNHVDYLVLNSSPGSVDPTHDINIPTVDIIDVEIVTGKSVKEGKKTVGDYLIALPMVR